MKKENPSWRGQWHDLRLIDCRLRIADKLGMGRTNLATTIFRILVSEERVLAAGGDARHESFEVCRAVSCGDLRFGMYTWYPIDPRVRRPHMLWCVTRRRVDRRLQSRPPGSQADLLFIQCFFGRRCIGSAFVGSRTPAAAYNCRTWLGVSASYRPRCSLRGRSTGP